VRSHYAEVFANLPTTLAALNDDVANDMAQRWFSSAELRSLNVSRPVDFFFLSELYMMQEVINTVCFLSLFIFVYLVFCWHLVSENFNLCNSQSFLWWPGFIFGESG